MKNNLHTNIGFDFNLIKLIGIILILLAIHFNNYIIGVIGLIVMLINIKIEMTEKPVGDNSIEVEVKNPLEFK